LDTEVDFRALAGNSGLFGGLSGLGWTIEHLSRVLHDVAPANPDEEEAAEGDLCCHVDTLLLKQLERGTWHGAFHLLGGLAGIGVYFLERLPSERATLGLELVIYHLEKCSRQSGEGIAWNANSQSLPQAGVNGGLGHVFGVADGVAGVIYVLNEACAAGIAVERASRLLEGAMKCLMHGRNSGSNGTPLSWRDGDLGVLAVCLQVSRCSGREDWREFSCELLDKCLTWSPSPDGILDASLCRGAMGVAHTFNRIYQSEGDPRCLEAAFQWTERALAMRDGQGGVGGFRTAALEADPSFLEGSIGTALALLAALTPVEPAWDRLLLLSGRTGAAA
jgi:hypothetical protein